MQKYQLFFERNKKIDKKLKDFSIFLQFKGVFLGKIV